MAYFKNIHSLAELKKEYRRLALENHPDKGGSTEVMQQINVEFERLHEIWKNDTTISANASGYENDYAGASAKETRYATASILSWTPSLPLPLLQDLQK